MNVFVRRTPGPRENTRAALLAAGLALGVGAVSFYLARALFSREEIVREPPPRTDGGVRGEGESSLPSPSAGRRSRPVRSAGRGGGP